MEIPHQNIESANTHSWLLHFPVMFFAAVMGIGGFTLVVGKALRVFELSRYVWIFDALTILSVVLFCGIVLIYLAKIIRHYSAFLQELKHPVRINFFAAISVSTLIVLMLSRSLPLGFALGLFYFGAFLQLVFSLYVVRFWFVNEMQQKMANPAWFIPIVGNLIVPLAGMSLNLQNQNESLIPLEILIFYFGMGSFFWILLNAALLIRLVFGENLPQKFLPTLFIFIAPPSVFGLDILVLFEGYARFAPIYGIVEESVYFGFAYFYGIASASFSVALFFMLLMISLFRVFTKLKFALSWWAFTFPTSAFTLCALELFAQGGSAFYMYLGFFGVVLNAIIVTIVAWHTFLAMKRKEICVLEQ